MTDAEVARAVACDTDAGPPTDAAFWAEARLVEPPSQRRVSIRIDVDVLDWFKSFGRGWQSRINTILRGYMERHRDAVEAARAARSTAAEPPHEKSEEPER